VCALCFREFLLDGGHALRAHLFRYHS
jgi:hypothetical protein